MTNDCEREKDWAERVSATARTAMGDLEPLDCPVIVWMTFYLPRPRRLCKRRLLQTVVPHDRKPDIDKLQRSVLDAMTGICFVDDARVCSVMCNKWYADADGNTGVIVEVKEAELHDMTGIA